MRKIEVEIFKFEELGELQKITAVIDYIENFLSGLAYEDLPTYAKQAVDENEGMQTPWFTSDTIFHDYRGFVEEDIIANDYEYESDGAFYL